MKPETYPLIGMHCASCKNLIERSVNKLPGVTTGKVNYGSETITLEYDTDKIKLDEIKKVISSLGSYELVSEETKPRENKDNELSALRTRLIVTGLLTAPFLIEMLSMLLNMWVDIKLPEILQFTIASGILFYGGKDIYKSGWSALTKFAFNMDSLIVIGTFTAWLYSTVVTFFPSLLNLESPEVYYEASAFIIFFILLGRYLEAKTKSKTKDAVKSLLELQAKDALVVRNGKETLVPISEVLVGDIVIVKPGQKVPVDGKIIEGSTNLNESMLTGESLPVAKNAGDTVVGATISLNGFIKIEALKIGADTVLSQIIKMVEEAQSSEAPIQKLADKVSSIFVPAVLSIGLVTFAVWLFAGSFSLAIYTAITVLIIACPCALGLATPTAVMVGTGKAARKGILIKNAQTLEISNRITHIIFDKTGTLTHGKPEVRSFMAVGFYDKKYISDLTYSTERLSHHPLAEAITKYLEGSQEIKIDKFVDVPGMGIKAATGKTDVVIGNRKMIDSELVEVSEEMESYYDEVQRNAQTAVFVAIDGKAAALIGISDTVKEGSGPLVRQLKNMGIKTYMMTGDNIKTAQFIAKEIGIDEVIAEVLPDQKADKVKALQQENASYVVAMVGDGINDAPALAQAHVGIAMGNGTDVAIESADIILVGGSIQKVSDAINLSKKTLQTIKQNLFWAFGYNTLGIPVAAGVLYPIAGVLLSPVIASLAMALSSVSVVGNSLRLRGK